MGDSHVYILGRDAMCIVGRCPEALWLFFKTFLWAPLASLVARAGSLFLCPGG